MKCKNCGAKTLSAVYCNAIECNRIRCREYYAKNKAKQQQRCLSNYHKYRDDPVMYERIREINRGSVAKKRFGLRRREEILEKYKNTCVYCLANDVDLVIHHIDHNGRGKKNPNNQKDNLVTCCKSCHASIHFHGRDLPILLDE